MKDIFEIPDKLKKNLLGMMGLGVVLLVVGLLLSTIKLGGDDAHGDSHGDAHSSIVLADANGSGGALIAQAGDGHDNSDTHEHEHDDGETHEHEHDAADGDHDHGHDDGAGHDEGHDNDHAAAAQGGGHHTAPPTMMGKIGVAWFVGSWFVFLLSIFGVFFIATKHIANAGWYVAIKRVLEPFYWWIPIGALLLIIGYFVFGSEIYMWHGATPHDELINGKRSFLNPGVYIGVLALIAGVYFLYGMTIRKNSVNEDKEGGLSFFRKSTIASAVFMPIFALSFSAASWMVIMSIDAHWFSTIFSVYNFAGMFVLGATVTSLIVVYLKENNYLPNVNGEHLHDLGKFMFAFSIFWAYIFISQYLLIWYANIPEEGIYYKERFDNYFGLFALNIAVNFFFPFLALMTRNAKRQYASLKTIGLVMLFGRFLDIFLMVAPGSMGEHWSVGVLIAALGMVLLQLGAFLFLYFRKLSQAPLTVKNHPYLEESFHHDTGV